jgi:2-polyprenyl-3-methyl-5-hydroxy-6-metoxy-1,4-benzoquinol methylase
MSELSKWQATQRKLRTASAMWRNAAGGASPPPTPVEGLALSPPELLTAPITGVDGTRGRAITRARRQLRRLLAPDLLEPQTRFNREVAARITMLSDQIAELDKQLGGRGAATGVLERGLREVDYLAFEDRFRGSSEAIATRQGDYVDYFAGVSEVLDIGCGRGEFLALLRDRGIPARGVDVDEAMVASCHNNGLYNVEHADALEFLDRQPDGVFGGVFISQVVEHLTTPELVELLRAVSRKCSPGAVLIVETLNPESFPVLARWYWLDPTHTRLVHPETLQYLIEHVGFRIETVQFRQPVEPGQRLPKLRLTDADTTELERYNADVEKVSSHLFGPLDYCVVGLRG